MRATARRRRGFLSLSTTTTAMLTDDDSAAYIAYSMRAGDRRGQQRGRGRALPPAEKGVGYERQRGWRLRKWWQRLWQQQRRILQRRLWKRPDVRERPEQVVVSSCSTGVRGRGTGLCHLLSVINLSPE